MSLHLLLWSHHNLLLELQKHTASCLLSDLSVQNEYASDRADSVYRGRRLGSSLGFAPRLPLLPLKQLVSHLCLAS